MKTIPILTTFAVLLLAGCVSGNKSVYQDATINDIILKHRRNEESRDFAWNQWRYAGSDEQYDYIYEYDPPTFPAIPPTGFRYYRLPVHEIDIKGPRYPFGPSWGNNREF